MARTLVETMHAVTTIAVYVFAALCIGTLISAIDTSDSRPIALWGVIIGMIFLVLSVGSHFLEIYFERRLGR
jgi:undecaprenyl pyrophosphate phosphatase UppP